MYFLSILVTSYKLLNCFSLIKNTSFILSTNVGKSDLTYLHGIRVLSLFWIILLHHTANIITFLGLPTAGEKSVNVLMRCHFYCIMVRLFSMIKSITFCRFCMVNLCSTRS